MRALHWFRKDLRLDDNSALAAAVSESRGDVVPVYVSEPAILRRADMAAIRVRFALECLRALEVDVAKAGGRVIVRHGDAAAEIAKLAREVSADAVFWNAEYEPQLAERDRRARAALEAAGVRVRVVHDRLLVAPGAVSTRSGSPFTVFSPFRRACEEIAMEDPTPRAARFARLEHVPSLPWSEAGAMGFHDVRDIPEGGEVAAKARLRAFCSGPLDRYDEARDLLAEAGTSRLSADLKFGTLSPRTVVAAARDAARGRRGAQRALAKFIDELRWRDFYAQILFHFPHVERTSYRPEYEQLNWNDDDEAFAKWRDGKTGFPVVDAAMRQLRSTGWMPNRARMIVASFLTKDLGIDWRRGERHFMNELIDGDLANNNGGWQWASSTGTDAVPYFRVFNPVIQGRRFDPEGRYVAKWCPELARLSATSVHAPWEATAIEQSGAGVHLGESYPDRCVDHAEARLRAIERFRSDARKSTGRPR